MTAELNSAPLPSETSLSRRDILLGIGFLAAAGITFARMPRHKVVAVAGKTIAAAIPTEFAGWSKLAAEGVVTPTDDEQKASAVYEEQVTLSFSNGRDPFVMFVLAYDRSQSGMLMVHRPESCYPGSGFTITADNPISVPLFPHVTAAGRFLSTRRDDRIEQVLYWTRLGDHFPNSWDAERRDLAWQNLEGSAPDGALVRFSCITADAEWAKAYLLHFARTLYTTCARDGRALLGGPTSASAGTV